MGGVVFYPGRQSLRSFALGYHRPAPLGLLAEPRYGTPTRKGAPDPPGGAGIGVGSFSSLSRPEFVPWRSFRFSPGASERGRSATADAPCDFSALRHEGQTL